MAKLETSEDLSTELVLPSAETVTIPQDLSSCNLDDEHLFASLLDDSSPRDAFPTPLGTQ